MLLQKERELIVEYGKKLFNQGLTKATGGNLSICNRQENLISITPSAKDYLKIKPEDITVLNFKNEIIDGMLIPSSELDMHMIFYKRRKDINAVVHTHSVFATTFSCLKWDIPPIHYLIGFAGEKVECAEYATFGTEELAENAFKTMMDKNAVLLANHGLLAVGANLQQAFYVAEMVEFCAEIYYRTKCIGDPALISDEEMLNIKEKFKTYGQIKRSQDFSK